MKSGPSLASAMFLALLISSAPAAQAQNDPPPDLNMLLNLDLFKPNPHAATQSGGDGSMLEQIQTLNALGYLGPNGSPPPNSYAPPQNFEPPPASGDGETD